MKNLHALQKLLLWLSYPIRKNPFFFLFMYVLVVLTFFYEKLPTEELLFYEGLFVDCYLLSALLVILPRRVARVVKVLFYTVGYVVTYVEWFLYARFYLRYTPVTIQMALETNPDEASDFCDAYLWNEKLWEVTWMIGGLLLLNILCECFGARLFRWLRGKFPPRVRPVMAMFFGAACMGYAGYCLYTTREDKRHFVDYFRLDGAERVERVMGPIRFYSPVYRLAYSVKFNRLAAGEIEILRKNMRALQVDSCAYACPNVVLIIGESYNKRHAQLYGYGLETTPNIARRRDKGELVCFADMVTPWNVTSNAFKSFLSTHSDDEPGLWADGVLFPALFKQAGYHVSFFTQQFEKSARQTAADFNGSFFLNDDELDSLCFDSRNKLKWRYDEGLLKEYKRHSKEYGEYNLFIFHLLGQHVAYEPRTPKKQVYFTKDSIRREDLTDAERQVVADYDNATRYNDFVVDGILNFFAGQDAVVIYMPDHGEEVYDEIRAFGRLHDANLSPALVRAEFEIPFWVWGSDTFRRNHRDLFRRIREISDKPFKTDDISHFLLGLAGIHTPYYQEERDWLSTEYKLHPRILKHTADYDSLMQAERLSAGPQ